MPQICVIPEDPDMLRPNRISAVVEPDLFEAVEAMARRDRVSVSQKARDLLRRATDLDEDADLAALAEERRRRGGKLLPHDAFWKKARGR